MSSKSEDEMVSTHHLLVTLTKLGVTDFVSSRPVGQDRTRYWDFIFGGGGGQDRLYYRVYVGGLDGND